MYCLSRSNRSDPARSRLFLAVTVIAAIPTSLVLANGSQALGAPGYAATPTSRGALNPAALPLGDGYVSRTPRVGYVDSCVTSFPNVGGAQADGPWINTMARTWDSLTKVAVQGSVQWPAARFSVTEVHGRRIIQGNDEPVDHTTGTFPISSSDPAYAYDRNPNRIVPQNLDWSLPLNPRRAKKASCTSGGTIGILDDGVALFNALDGEGRDAGAHEIQDSCGEHPQENDVLHHHDVPSCIVDRAKGRSTLVGYAIDGFGIYVERNKNGSLVTNTQLDACHGRTSRVRWNGKEQPVYHYDATLEYPYTIGCFRGTPLSASELGSTVAKGGSGGGPGAGAGRPPTSAGGGPSGPPSGGPPSGGPPPGGGPPPPT